MLIIFPIFHHKVGMYKEGKTQILLLKNDSGNSYTK